jgi:hypothetical protein
MDMDKTFDNVEQLRTDYLRELTALSKMLIALSSGALSLLLSPSGISLSIKAGSRVTVVVWTLLCGGAALGFIQVFLFSSRFKSHADYLWGSLLIDTRVTVRKVIEDLGRSPGPGLASDEDFLEQADKHKRSHHRKYIMCRWLILAQALSLLAAFVLLAYPVYRMLLSGATR